MRKISLENTQNSSLLGAIALVLAHNFTIARSF